MCKFLSFFATSLVLRCGIRSEISTLNFETTLHTVFGSCFRNKWACSLAVRLFSHCRIHSVDPRYVMLWRVVETCAAQPPQFAEKRKKRVCLRDGGGPYSGVKHHEAFGSIRWGNKKIEEHEREVQDLPLLCCLETWNCSLWELCVKLLTWFR